MRLEEVANSFTGVRMFMLSMPVVKLGDGQRRPGSR